MRCVGVVTAGVVEVGVGVGVGGRVGVGVEVIYEPIPLFGKFTILDMLQ